MLSLLLDIARGVDYLHGQSTPIIHGDLKGNNILIDHREGAVRACICDFGLARVMEALDGGLSTTSTSSIGNVRWMAFERVDPEKYGIQGTMDAKTIHSDVFELMRTFLEVLTGRPPFAQQNEWTVYAAVRTGRNPDRPHNGKGTLLDEVWSLLEAGWSEERTRRPSSSEVLQNLSIVQRFRQLVSSMLLATRCTYYNVRTGGNNRLATFSNSHGGLSTAGEFRKSFGEHHQHSPRHDQQRKRGPHKNCG